MGQSFCSKKTVISDTEIDTENKFDEMSSKKNSKKRKLTTSKDSDGPSKKKQKTNAKSKTNVDGTMTRQEFMKHAKDVTVNCGDMEFAVRKRKNKTGSVGWNASHHGIIKLNKNKKVAVMVSLNATVIGSKKWEDGDKDDDEKDKEKEKEKKKVNKEKGDTMTKSEFLSIAKDLKLELFDEEITLKKKKASTGSVGWGAAGLKIKIELNGIALRLQTSINITVKNSKNWDEGDDEEGDDQDEEDQDENDDEDDEEDDEEEDEDDDIKSKSKKKAKSKAKKSKK